MADQRAAYGFCGQCEKPIREGATCCPEMDVHEHEWKYVRTNENWFDGDETDIYECPCGATDRRYTPR